VYHKLTQTQFRARVVCMPFACCKCVFSRERVLRTDAKYANRVRNVGERTGN
jgi:hypothetical protein